MLSPLKNSLLWKSDYRRVISHFLHSLLSQFLSLCQLAARGSVFSFHIFHLCKLIYTDWSRIYYLAASNAALDHSLYNTHSSHRTHTTQRKSTYGLPGRHFRHFMRFLCVEPRVVGVSSIETAARGSPAPFAAPCFAFPLLQGKRGETHNNF